VLGVVGQTEARAGTRASSSYRWIQAWTQIERGDGSGSVGVSGLINTAASSPHRPAAQGVQGGVLPAI